MRLAAGLTLPALGLVAVPLSTSAIGDPLSWVLILLTITGASALSWYMNKNADTRETIAGALRVQLPLYRGSRIFRSASSAVGIFFREAAAILEGEGGMLWLLVLVVIIWLARIS